MNIGAQAQWCVFGVRYRLFGDACQAPTSDQPPALRAPSGPKNRRQWIRQDRKDLRGSNMVQRRAVAVAAGPTDADSGAQG